MRNKYFDLSVGTTIKKIGLALAVFVITFGVVSSIRNANGTYAADETSEEKCSVCISDTNLFVWSSSPINSERNAYCSEGWSDAPTISKEKCISYGITLILNDGTYNNSTDPIHKFVKKDDSFTFPEPEKNGWKFLYWESWNTNLNMGFYGGDSPIISNLAEGYYDFVFSAQYEEINDSDETEVIIELITMGGTAEGGFNTSFPLSCKISSGENSCPITLPNVTKTNSTFNGWSTSTSCNNPQKDSINVSESDNGKKYYACYTSNNSGSQGGEENKTYQAVFYLNGGTLNGSTNNIIVNMTSDGKITTPAAPERENYKFLGWYTTKTNFLSGANEKIASYADFVYYNGSEFIAKWEPISSPNNNNNNNNNNNSEPSVNPDTGSWMLYLVYLAGTLALGYTGYYSYKVIKSKNN